MWKENTKCSCYNYHGSETSGVGNLDAILCWFPHIVLSFLAVSVVANIAGQHPATYGLSFGGNYICSGFCQTLCPVKTIMKVGLHLYSPFSNAMEKLIKIFTRTFQTLLISACIASLAVARVLMSFYLLT